MDEFLSLINVDDFTSEDESSDDECKETKESESSSEEFVPNNARLNLRIPVLYNNN